MMENVGFIAVESRFLMLVAEHEGGADVVVVRSGWHKFCCTIGIWRLVASSVGLVPDVTYLSIVGDGACRFQHVKGVAATIRMASCSQHIAFGVE